MKVARAATIALVGGLLLLGVSQTASGAPIRSADQPDVGEPIPTVEEEQHYEELASRPFNLASQRMLASAREVNALHPNVASLLRVDYEREAVVASYFTGAAREQIDAYTTAIVALGASFDFPFLVEEATYLEADQTALATSMGTEPAKWVDTLGGAPCAVGALPDGTVFVQFQEGAPKATSQVINGIVVNVLPEPAIGYPQSQSSDVSPYKAGTRIYTPTGGCTAGFKWLKWSNGNTYGSTAEHCGFGSYTHTVNGPNSHGGEGQGVVEYFCCESQRRLILPTSVRTRVDVRALR